MNNAANFIAVDLGASSGRVMVGAWNGRIFSLDELHRFQTSGIRVAGRLHWDVLAMWSEMQTGLMKCRTRFDAPTAIGVDAWGVDFALLDVRGHLLSNPYHYRDSRTDGILDLVFQRIHPYELFRQTGVQPMQINTLFQLFSMVHGADPQVTISDTLLMIPDLFHYFLCGARVVEHTQATTTQMYSPSHRWARNLLDNFDVPNHILPEVVVPGTRLDPVRKEVLRDTGFSHGFPVVAVASHDTASAVAAIPEMNENSAFISSGTWSLVGVELREPMICRRAFSLGFTNEGGAEGTTLLVKNVTGLWLLQECQRQWANDGWPYTWSDITAMAASTPIFSFLLDVDDDHFRTPSNMPQAIVDYCSRTSQPDAETIGAVARGCFESLALKYRSVMESLQTLTCRRFESVRIVGGGCLNALLCQMTADACNRVVVSGPAEASALGNVMLQAIATGHISNILAGRAAIADSTQCVSYFPQRTELWDEAFSRLEKIQAMARE